MSEIIIREWNQKTIRQREDGYVCLTDMCKAENKFFGHWKENNDTKEFLEALSSDIGIPPISAQQQGFQALVEVKKGGNPEDQGTWGHPYVAVELARWLKPSFSIYVNKWVANFINSFDDFESTAKKDKAGFVYLVKVRANSFYKIGKSKDAYKRLQTLQTGSPLELLILKRVFSTDCLALEKKLHEYYEAYSIRGEWFDLPEEEVNNFQTIALELDEEIEQLKEETENV